MSITTTTFRTEPFSCPSCISKIESAVGRMEGVHSVDVGFNSSRVKVAHDTETVAADTLARTITDLGYAVRSFA